MSGVEALHQLAVFLGTRASKGRSHVNLAHVHLSSCCPSWLTQSHTQIAQRFLALLQRMEEILHHLEPPEYF